MRTNKGYFTLFSSHPIALEYVLLPERAITAFLSKLRYDPFSSVESHVSSHSMLVRLLNDLLVSSEDFNGPLAMVLVDSVFSILSSTKVNRTSELTVLSQTLKSLSIEFMSFFSCDLDDFKGIGLLRKVLLKIIIDVNSSDK